MPDIEIRFHKDMLVLSAPIEYALERQGIDVQADAEFVSLMEPETVHDALKMHVTAGAQRLVTNTEGIGEARLATSAWRAGRRLAAAALASAQECKPQHLVCEVERAAGARCRQRNVARPEHGAV